MIINYIFMKKASYYLSQLNKDKKCLFFCLFVILINIVYLYQNNDNYFIFGYGYGLERLINLNQTQNSILNVNAFFLRGFSFIANLIVINFILLMIYNLVFKLFKSIRHETLFIYFINILLILVILYTYLVMI